VHAGERKGFPTRKVRYRWETLVAFTGRFAINGSQPFCVVAEWSAAALHSATTQNQLSAAGAEKGKGAFPNSIF